MTPIELLERLGQDPIGAACCLPFLAAMWLVFLRIGIVVVLLDIAPILDRLNERIH